MSEEKRLGHVLQLARKKAGLTQQNLCEKTGMSLSTLAKIERGAIGSPSVFTILQIAQTLGRSMDELLGGVEPRKSNTSGTISKKVSRSGVRFVYFDMNGVLVRAAVSKACMKLAEESGVTPDVIETIFWQYNSDVCRGSMSLDEFNTILAERLDMLVDWNRYYLMAVEPTPGISELVEWAGENYRVGVVTNTFPGLIEPMFERGILPNSHFDLIIDSSEVHALKPDARMFEIAAERAGISPAEILLVDDDRLNLAAAGQFGWHTMGFDAYQPETSIVAISTALQPADS
ncbi:MAG TPA: HAD-IA family hydrolase [Verrucomicrobiae bacterium]|nr:HAD-IA family hydrolase [Verrucomicrobiae bacterium]